MRSAPAAASLRSQPQRARRGASCSARVPTGKTAAPLTDTVGEWIGEFTGNVAVQAVEVYARDADREKELDARFIPGIPSAIQFGYLIGLVFGVLGLSVARNWWARIWPPEQLQEYRGTLGYPGSAGGTSRGARAHLPAHCRSPGILLDHRVAAVELHHRSLPLFRLDASAARAACRLKPLEAGSVNSMATLKGKTLFITGASRGIGLAIALRAARDGANVAIAAKTAEPHPKLEGTIHTAAAEIEKAGGRALAIACDIRFEDQVQAAVAKTVETFGGLDICVNNASAISLTPLEKTDMKRVDLMLGVNTRGTLLVTKSCLPHLRKAANGHVLMLSPPLDLAPKWFAGHVAYSIAKYGMSLAVLGLAEELKARRDRSQRALAAHDDRHRRGRQHPRRRQAHAHEPDARDHGGRRAPRADSGRQELHGPLPDRRHASL